jgi:hypothetical protein
MRVPGWPRALSEYLIGAQERYVREGFGYGRLDCCTFAADWVRICTGTDPLQGLRGRYDTEQMAEALIAAEGSIGDALANRFTEIPAAIAQRGDLAYMDVAGRSSVGIFFNSGARLAALFLGEGGFTMHGTARIARAFAVGREA